MADSLQSPTITTCPHCGVAYPKGAAHSCSQTPSERPELVATIKPGESDEVDSLGPTVTPAQPLQPPPAATPQPKKSAETDDLIGTVINDRYEIEKRLSKGGMGVVYLARHRALDAPVAIKVLLRPRSEEDQVRFLLEAKIASKVKHANTVYISDFGQLPDGRNYLAMELLKGRPLSDDVGRGPLPVLRVLRIAVQIARGLKAVHDLGIVHRDIKPANVFLVEQDGNPDFVKIVDFGIAKVVKSDQPALSPLAAARSAEDHARAAGSSDPKAAREPELTQPGTVMGTPAFMSPEQTRGETIDAATDQYAFGCMLYQMLTGRTPFTGKTMMEVMLQHSDPAIPPVPPRKMLAGLQISDALEQAVLRMLAKFPEKRYPSMGEVAQVLEQELDLLLLARGDKRLMTAAHVEALEQKARAAGPAILLFGLRVPLWVVAPLVVLMLGGAGLWGYSRWHAGRRTERPRLRWTELAGLRAQALAILRGELAQPAPEVRVAALVALGQSRDSSLSKELEPFLRDKDAQVQAQAIRTLALLGDPAALPALRALGEQPLSAVMKVEVAGAMQRLREPSAQPQLLAALDSADAEVQFTAAMVLCDDSSVQRAQDVLRTIAQRPQTPKEVQQNILACQAQGGSAPARQTLTEMARLRGPEQVTAEALLWQLGDDSSREALRRAVRQGGADGLRAARALASAQDAESLELLATVVNNPDANPAARQLAADGLGDSGDTEYARLLATFLPAGPQIEPALRTTAAGAIVRLAALDPSSLSASSLRWAQSARADKSWLVREAAVAVLADSTAPEAVPLLAWLANDGDVRLRRSALRALGRRREPSALLALREGLSDGDASVRLESIRSLGRVLAAQQQRGQANAQSEPARWLRAHYDQATAAEQVVIAGILEQLGDSSHRAQMLALLGRPDVALRRLVVASRAAGTDTAARALQDSDPAVRLAAARQLASQGDARALPILREAVQRGGADGLRAFGLLRALGEKLALPADLEQTLRSAAVAERLAAVAALSTLPPDLALPLLTRAAHDPDAQVRRQAAVVAARFPVAESGRAILRRLLADSDVTVRARAQALLVRPPESTQGLDPESEDEQAAEAPVHTSDGNAPAPPQEAAEVSEPEPADLAMLGDKGLLVIDGEPGVLYQLDGRAWQLTSGQPVPVAPGPHHLSAMTGQQDFTAIKKQRVMVQLATSRVEQLAHSAQQSLQRADYRKAQRQLDQAVSLCAQDHKNAVPCTILSFDMSYTLGQIREKQLEWAEAMTEYQKTAALSHRIKGKQDIKANVQTAIARLLPRVCKVLIKQQVGHRCVEETVWVGPGQRLIKVGGKLQQIEARVQQELQVGTCQ